MTGKAAGTRTAFVAAVILAAAAGGCSNDFEKADELLATGDFEGAAAIYEKRLEGDSEDAAGTIGLARVRYAQALGHAKGGRDTIEEWNRAVELLEKAVVIDPAPKGVQPVGLDMYADALLRCGRKRFEAESWQAAAEALSKAAEQGEEGAELWTMLARAEAGSGNFKPALKAARRAAKLGAMGAELLREAAGWGTKVEMPWMHHYFFYRAEKADPAGFQFLRPIDISKGLSQRYGALNMINDTLGLFLFNEEVEPRAWGGILEREPLIEDMEKFIGRKPPKQFKKADRTRLHWLVYHYWNTTGIVFAYLGDGARAKKWFEKAVGIDRKKIRHPDVSSEQLSEQAGWAEANLHRL